MNYYQADMHIHTVLSPCGDLSMSPSNIVDRATSIGLNLIAITDHNSTLHGPVTRKLAERKGILVIYGAEITTKEEVHCVCLFHDENQRLEFQDFINRNLPNIKNNPEIFGHQVVVDENEDILEEIEPLLISALNVSIDEVEREAHRLGGLFIPAHIDRQKYSLTSQLGFIPKDLNFDALEISKEKTLNNFSYIKKLRFIRSSDAHTLNQIGSANTQLKMESNSWDEIKKAVRGIEGREVIIS